MNQQNHTACSRYINKSFHQILIIRCDNILMLKPQWMATADVILRSNDIMFNKWSPHVRCLWSCIGSNQAGHVTGTVKGARKRKLRSYSLPFCQFKYIRFDGN